MKNTVLLEAITAEDKQKIKSYIETYGIAKDYFIGVDKWLQFWSYSNQKLFRLLGKKLIHKIDYEYEKDRALLILKIQDELFTLPFKKSYHSFYMNVIRKYYNQEEMDFDTKKAFSALTDCDNFINDKISLGIHWRKPGSKTMLQLQPGMKPMRAFQKLINYFKDEFSFDGFEEFRIAHSMILNDRYVKGKLCFSIHPLDFLTMSDNASDWSSCMSWRGNGCYHLGTVEMMNSNNVICCYIESENSLLTWQDHDTMYSWNSKKFRVLFYATKDIIVNGKSYPFENQKIVMTALEELKRLAKENWDHEYSFGPELYKDMIHINYGADVQRNKDWIATNSTTKHNIIFDTKAMYNDMFNDNHREYWCYRNKVKKNKVISISGKANCLCCNNTVWEDTNDYFDYNDRYTDVGQVICHSCISDNSCFRCSNDFIRGTREGETLYTVKINGEEKKICSKCYNIFVKTCPDCGKPFFWGEQSRAYYSRKKIYYMKSRDGVLEDIHDKSFNFIQMNPIYFRNFEEFSEYQKEEFKREDFLFEVLNFHASCGQSISASISKNITSIKTYIYDWRRRKTGEENTFVITDPEINSKYGYWSLETPEYKPGIEIDS